MRSTCREAKHKKNKKNKTKIKRRTYTSPPPPCHKISAVCIALTPFPPKHTNTLSCFFYTQKDTYKKKRRRETPHGPPCDKKPMQREAGASLDVGIPSSRAAHGTLSPRSPKSEQRAPPANARRIVDHVRLNPLARPDLLPLPGGPQLRETASAPLGDVDSGSFGHAGLVSPKERLRGVASPRETRFDSTFSLTPKADACTATSFALAQHPSETPDGLGSPTPSTRTLQQRQRRGGGGAGGAAPRGSWRLLVVLGAVLLVGTSALGGPTGRWGSHSKAVPDADGQVGGGEGEWEEGAASPPRVASGRGVPRGGRGSDTVRELLGRLSLAEYYEAMRTVCRKRVVLLASSSSPLSPPSGRSRSVGGDCHRH